MIRIFLLLFLLSVCHTAIAAGEDQPNIVFVLADDFGLGDVSCYGGDYPTPHLDQMAKEGIRFSRYYSGSPICSPSRAALITGQYPARWRITSFLQTRKGNRDCDQVDFLAPEAPSLPRILQQAGFATAHIGKWHLGGGRDVTMAPRFAAYGYDVGMGTWESPEPHPDITALNWIWSTADKVPRWERTSWMVDQTIRFLDEHPSRPCFVNLWLDDTHTPWIPGPEALQGDRAKDGDGEANFKKVLTDTDRQLGRLLEHLRSESRQRDTLVILVGDNGPLPTFDQKRTVGLRGSKLSLYEGGIRVPCIVWWAKKRPSSHLNETTVLAAVDILPTLCALVGVPLPAGYSSDGENLAAALQGQSPARTKALYWEYGRREKGFAYPKDNAHRSPTLAVRDGSMKLLLNPDGSSLALFDLDADPHEATNLANQQPEVAARLRKAALDWKASWPTSPN